MGWFRGTDGDDVARPQDSARTDEILVKLVEQTEQLNERLTRLEDRFERSLDAAQGIEHDDLIELRLHSARLAAELSRVTVELRSEIAELVMAAQHGDRREAPALDADETFVDLTEDSPARARPVARSSGWRPE